MQSATMPSLKVNCDATDAADTTDDHYGLAHANRLVQSIFLQITEGDAPSGNFENYNAMHSLTGSNDGGHYSRQGVSTLLPSVKKSSAARTSSQSDYRFANYSYSQGDYDDITSTTASEPSLLSCNGMSPFASPKSSSKFPPRPPSSSSSYKKDNSDTSNNSLGGRPSLSTHSNESSYGIGASLMGTLALADLCSRTLKTGSRKEGEKRGKNYLNNHQHLSGALSPPPLSPLESEESSHCDKAQNLPTFDQTKAGLGMFSEQIHSDLGKLAEKPSHGLTSDRDPTPRVHNGGMDASSFNMGTPCDDQGFPCDNGMGLKINDNNRNDITGITLETDTSCNSESGTFSFEDAITEDAGNKLVEEQTTPVQRPASSDTAGRAARGHKYVSPLTVQRSILTDTAGRSPGQKRRIMMFGSEYARILSSSKLLSPPPNGNPHLLSSASKVRRSSSAVSNKIKARLSSSVSAAQSYASSAKCGVESSGTLLRTLDDCPRSIATAAITDVIVTDASDIPPRGYYRALQLGEESMKNMVPGLKAKRSFLNVKKEPNWDRAVQRPCVTAFCVIYPDRNEFVPPGFSVVRHYQPSGNSKKKEESDNLGPSASPAANINQSTSGERVYICYRRSREGNPITGIMCLKPTKGDLIPEGYTVLERTPRNFLADMAAKSGQPVFLAYRQRLENLECLRPLPLVLSVSHLRPDAGRKELKAYYCTGGTVVSSDVGRYHIMDRSTHSLLSSSSAQTRLNVIQSSRKESETAVPAWVSSASTHSSSSQTNANRNLRSASSAESPGEKDDSSESSGMRHLKTESFDTCFSKSPSLSSFASSATANSLQQSPTLTKSTSPGCGSFFSHSDDTLQTSLDAMHFIPPIECAKTVFQNGDAAHSEHLLQNRVAAITPILTSCYTSQGGVALMAVEGLITMLKDTTFFAQDVAGEDGNVDGIIESSARLTLLDLAIQVVCDVATSSARETYFRSCVDFVSDAVRYAGGRLNDRTIGFVLRFYLFVFYFGASIPTTGWPFHKERHEGKAGILDDFLLSDNPEQNVPSCAPQAAAIALKEFVSIMLSRIGTGMKKAQRQSGKTAMEDKTTSPRSFVYKILSHLVESAMDRVDVANYTQLAMYQIHRSGGSELFWHDMVNSIGEGLFGQDSSSNQGVIHSNIISFAILSSFIKISSGKIRRAFNNTEPVPRDVASKLLSFELLLHFIKMWHVAVSAEIAIYCAAETKNHANAVATQNSDAMAMESVATMIYILRRLVVPTLLSNTSAAIEDCRVYRRVLRVISQLWCNPHYRCQMKIDLAVLIEHFILKVVYLGPQVNPVKHPAGIGSDTPSSSGDMPSLLQQQLDVLEEMKIWFSSNPKDALDLYINYDDQGDMLPTRYCKLMDKMCEALSTLAEQCGEIISEHGRFASISGGHGSPRRSAMFPRENEMSKAHVREAALSTREKSFGAITSIVKSMMDCAIMSCKQRDEKLLVAAALGVADSYAEDKSSIFCKDTSLGLSPQMSPGPSFGDKNIADYWKTSIEKRKAPLQPIMLSSSQEIDTPISFNIKHSLSEDSSKQAQSQHKQESFDVAFDLFATKGLKKGIDYLIACNLLIPSPRHISAFLRIHQSSIDPGILGEYLGEGGITGSDKDFWNLVRFYFARATSFVGMNIEQALRHFLTDCGFRLPGEAQKIDRIISTFSQCYWEDNAGDLHKCPFQDQDTVFLVSFAIIMLNTDLHKSHVSKGKAPKRMTKTEFIKNLSGVYDGVDKFRDYIYAIYHSIESTPIAISNFLQDKKKREEEGPPSLPFKDQANFATSVQSWVKSVKPAQELLRTVAVRHDNFATVDGHQDDEVSLQDLTRQMFSSIWHHIHGAINATIDNAHLDLAGLDCCIDVLEYSLCTASYLGMTVERSAFSKLLVRVNRFNDLQVKREIVREDKPSKESSNRADSGGTLNFEDVDQVRSLTKKLHTSLFVDDRKVETMKQVARRIRNGDILLNDPSRTFVKEGELVKKHQLAGRSSTYRFFLFSDVLVYAHKSPAEGDYKVHEELPLHLMKIEDTGSTFSNTKENSFHIHHPNKSFLVIASSKTEKQQWIDDINNSIRREVKRKAKIEKSRIEAARRAAI